MGKGKDRRKIPIDELETPASSENEESGGVELSAVAGKSAPRKEPSFVGNIFQLWNESEASTENTVPPPSISRKISRSEKAQLANDEPEVGGGSGTVDGRDERATEREEDDEEGGKNEKREEKREGKSVRPRRVYAIDAVLQSRPGMALSAFLLILNSVMVVLLTETFMVVRDTNLVFAIKVTAYLSIAFVQIVLLAEIIGKVASKRLSAFKSLRTIYDVITLAGAIISFIVGTSMTEKGMDCVSTWCSGVWPIVFLAIRPLRILAVFEAPRTMVTRLRKVLPNVGWLWLAVLLLFFAFSAIATAAFGPGEVFDPTTEDNPCGPRPCWQSISDSAYTLFQLLIFDDFSAVTRPTIERVPGSFLFFIFFVVLVPIFTLQLTTAALVDAFNVREKEELAATKRQLENSNRRLRREQMKTEKAQLFMEHVINSIADPILVVTKSERCVLANDSFCRHFIMERDRLIGEKLDGLGLRQDASRGGRLRSRLSSLKPSSSKPLLANQTHTQREIWYDSLGCEHTMDTHERTVTDGSGTMFKLYLLRDASEERLTTQRIRALERFIVTHIQTKNASSLPRHDSAAAARMNDKTISRASDLIMRVALLQPELLTLRSDLASPTHGGGKGQQSSGKEEKGEERDSKSRHTCGEHSEEETRRRRLPTLNEDGEEEEEEVEVEDRGDNK